MTRTLQIVVGALAVVLAAGALAFIAYLYGFRDEPPARPVWRTVMSVLMWTGVLLFGLGRLREALATDREDLHVGEEAGALAERDERERGSPGRDSEG